MLKLTASSQASSLPPWICVEHKYCAHRRSPVGVGLPTIAVDQSALMLKLTASSRASPLPQWICVKHTQIPYSPVIPCGSGLAHECGGSVSIDVEADGLITSKLAPTVDLCRTQILCSPTIPLWEWACPR